eukprot:CAMPEP_0169140056 /NCGR_PEP_ID=MMETSP1015-20121227/43372_1 /TAXON_ID=342587 /ORGANISM="Karlodinium micrum, Strain CCMP2283" /LENGTH=119 /DNA_ID=CAMNT_0009205949 /DNA_START=72 /DNA_END=427 /DNA_ORIENTATION=-
MSATKSKRSQLRPTSDHRTTMPGAADEDHRTTMPGAADEDASDDEVQHKHSRSNRESNAQSRGMHRSRRREQVDDETVDVPPQREDCLRNRHGSSSRSRGRNEDASAGRGLLQVRRKLR